MINLKKRFLTKIRCTTLKDHNLVPWQKFKNWDVLQICPSSFILRKPFSSILICKKLKFDEARYFFSTFSHLQGDHYCACTQKWCHFSYFSKTFQTNKKFKKLRPKRTNKASRGGGPALKFNRRKRGLYSSSASTQMQNLYTALQ